MSNTVDELAAVIWMAMHPPGSSWEARLSWATVPPDEQAAMIERGVDPDNFENGDIEKAKAIARAVMAHLKL